jgi:hypothetical protein
MIMKWGLSILFCILAIQAFSQDCDLSRYYEKMQAADSLATLGAFSQAYENLNAAEYYCKDSIEAISLAKEELFIEINQLRTKAEEAEQSAKAALEKANNLISAFYFYQDRFALAYGKKGRQEQFFFIDKDGEEVAYLGYWARAQQFDRSGFARVVDEEGRSFLLDTDGTTYRAAYQIDEVTFETKAVDLRDKQFNSFPTELLDNYQLKIILLDGSHERPNSMETIPMDIARLRNLQRLSLSHCKLKTLPKSIGQLKKLNVLNLSNNQLKSLPASLGDLSFLTTLNLMDNELKRLPPSIGNMVNLRHLNLEYNRISELPLTLKNLELRLQNINLKLNPIERDNYSKLKERLPSTRIEVDEFRKYAFRNEYYHAYHDLLWKVESSPEEYRHWYNLSTYALYVNKPDEAVEAAKRSLALNPISTAVETNLALGYLLLDDYEKADLLFKKWKSRVFPLGKTLCDDVFLNTIADLKAVGIEHEDFERAEAFFRN